MQTKGLNVSESRVFTEMTMSNLRCPYSGTQLTPTLGYSAVESQITRTLRFNVNMFQLKTWTGPLARSRVRTISNESGCIAAAMSIDRRAVKAVEVE